MKELFEFIEFTLRGRISKTIDFHTWGDVITKKHFPAAKKLSEQVNDNPVISVNGKTYLITCIGATNGHGGMSEGSPETITIKEIKPTPIEFKDLPPEKVENPNFNQLISLAEDIMGRVSGGHYMVDADDTQWCFEEVMKAIYGRDVFTYLNKQQH